MPAWGLRYGGFTVVYILENPFDNDLIWNESSGQLEMRLSHRFQRNQPGKEHSILVRIGGDSPVETALQFRAWFREHNRFVTMREKIRATPDAARLLGAAHIYIWANSKWAANDVTNWPAFASVVRGGPAPPYVSALEKRQILASLTPEQERAGSRYLAPEAERGSAISPRMMKLLHDAGFDRLWLGAPGKEVELARQSPETLRLAHEYGFLFAPYDSYHSIHSPDEKDSWPTAQFHRKIFETGAIVNESGAKSRGFQGKGYHLSSLAAAPYFKRRVEAILGSASFNSWFVDCDATGELFDNYSAAFPQTKEQDMQQRVARLEWLAHEKKLVVGSEGGAWFATPAIHFAQGMLTPLFGWKDPLLRDPQSKYFLGKYWPPEAPAMFFQSVELPEKYKALYFDPRYRLPLFEIAFHDSVIAASHWTVSTLKFSNVRRIRELLELLYGVPPLYHLNREEIEQRLPEIVPHYAVFTKLHREIGLLPMTDFSRLNKERTVQRTVFGGSVEVTANFSGLPFRSGDSAVSPGSVSISRR